MHFIVICNVEARRAADTKTREVRMWLCLRTLTAAAGASIAESLGALLYLGCAVTCARYFESRPRTLRPREITWLGFAPPRSDGSSALPRWRVFRMEASAAALHILILRVRGIQGYKESREPECLSIAPAAGRHSARAQGCKWCLQSAEVPAELKSWFWQPRDTWKLTSLNGAARKSCGEQGGILVWPGNVTEQSRSSNNQNLPQQQALDSSTCQQQRKAISFTIKR